MHYCTSMVFSHSYILSQLNLLRGPVQCRPLAIHNKLLNHLLYNQYKCIYSHFIVVGRMNKIAMFEEKLISSYMKEKDTIRDMTVAILRLMLFGK